MQPDRFGFGVQPSIPSPRSISYDLDEESDSEPDSDELDCILSNVKTRSCHPVLKYIIVEFLESLKSNWTSSFVNAAPWTIYIQAVNGGAADWLGYAAETGR